MMFKKKSYNKYEKMAHDKDKQKPVIMASICSGEQVAGFIDIKTERFEEVMLIRNSKDLQKFKEMYGIEGEVLKMY